MSQQNQVIIVQKGSAVPQGLRETLQSKGYGTRVCVSNEEAEASLDGDSDNMVVVYCGPETDCSKTVGTLLDAKKLHPSPLIFIGKDADQFESQLNHHFVLATTITLPCATSDVVAAVEYVIRFVEKLKKSRAEGVTQEGDPVHQLYRQFPSIPELVFDQLVKQGILSKDLGGSSYATTFRPDKLSNRPFMPATEGYKRAIESLGDRIPEVKIGRLYRTAYLSEFFFQAIGVTGANLEGARAAAFLYPSGFIATERDLYLQEYLTEIRTSLRKELSERVKATAVILGVEHKAPLLERIVGSVGRFLGGDDIPTDDIEDLIASAIAGADMIDRIVFSRGAFQPVAAYCVLSKLKAEPVAYLHPFILGCIIKLLAEAVTSNASHIAVDKNMRAMRKLMGAADEIAEVVLTSEENSVPLSSLAPGMKLSRPISSFDGKEILNDQMVLDQDLIWRLWQLAAIRPLNNPVTVFND